MFHNIQQNSDKWELLKLGVVSGSSMSKVMANFGKAFGDPAKKYAVKIAREQVTGEPSINDQVTTAHMERGHAQEPIARALYEEFTFNTVTNGGFFHNGKTGCSPDGLVDDDGLIEIKSVVDNVHYSTIVRDSFDPTYKWQIYHNLKETGRDWLDYVSYCADFPPATRLYVKRVYAKDCKAYFEMIDERLGEFFALVNEIKKVIKG